jgi:hypothetical protein
MGVCPQRSAFENGIHHGSTERKTGKLSQEKKVNGKEVRKASQESKSGKEVRKGSQKVTFRTPVFSVLSLP